MNENKKVMPERFYSLDDNMSIDKIIQAQDTGECLVGKVLLYNSVSKAMEVDLGNGYIGFLPIEYASIYPVILPNGNLASATRKIIGKTILVNVIDIINNIDSPKAILSRKGTMLKAFDFISNSIGKEIECCITSFESYGVYVDVGNGIDGMIHFKELCIPRVNHFSDIGINIGDKITAKIISVDNKFHVSLSYKDYLKIYHLC